MVGKNAWLYVVLAVTALFSVRLRNTAFIDEALYLNAGKNYLAHWFGGADLPDGTGYLFAGVPVLYPVLAGALDNVGGLYLVRAFSLLCVLGTAVLIQRTTRAMFGGQSGTLAAAAFCFTGSVIFIGWFATFDALCILLLAAGAYVGVTRHGNKSAILVGLLLATAITVKYTAILFVPVMLAVMVVANSSARWRRLGIATATALAALVVPYLLWGEHVREDIVFTTTGRKALSPVPRAELVGILWGNVGLLITLAVIGAIALVASRRSRAALLGIGLLIAAAALPVSQIYLGEAVSFEKHLAYAALCFAPLVGYLLARVRAVPLASVVSTMLVLIMVIIGGFRSIELFRSWLNVEPALQVVAENPVSGRYLSSVADPLAYHTRDAYPGIRWESPYGLYADPATIDDVIAKGEYEQVVLWNESTGSPQQDAGQAALIDALNASDIYELRESSGHEADKWLFYTFRTKGQ
jgi:4-amino-4-deoxy-L-arabinose transferase-like glycosyltransferase